LLVLDQEQRLLEEFVCIVAIYRKSIFLVVDEVTAPSEAPSEATSEAPSEAPSEARRIFNGAGGK